MRHTRLPGSRNIHWRLGQQKKWPGETQPLLVPAPMPKITPRRCPQQATVSLFIRANVAGRLFALIELAGLSLTDAANRIVHEEPA